MYVNAACQVPHECPECHETRLKLTDPGLRIKPVNNLRSLLPLTSRNVDGFEADGVWGTRADGLVGTMSLEGQ